MAVPAEFRELLEVFAGAMTRPTFQSFLLILGGWILARRHQLTGALRAGGSRRLPKHFSAYHRVFSQARWDREAVGLALAQVLLGLIPGLVDVVIDDTLCRHGGWKIFGASPHFDPLLSSRKQSQANRSGRSGTAKSRGHCWVVLGLALEFPFWKGHVFCLPVLFRLYLTKATAARARRTYYSKPQLARQMLQLLTDRFPQRSFHLLIDSAYAGQDMLKERPANCQITAGWLLQAALYAPAPEKPPGKKGPGRTHGDRLPGIAAMLAETCPHLELDTFGLHRTLRVASVLACFHATPQVLLRIVASEPLSAGGKPQDKLRAVFYSTCTDWEPAAILTAYARRWSIEVTFRQVKQDLGLAQPQAWSRPAVERTAPVLFMLYGLVVVWFARHGHRHWRPIRWPWYLSKRHPSFADMLATLQAALRRRPVPRFFPNPPATKVLGKPLRRLLTRWKPAA